ncbi:MAG TPA: hypothetical protein VJU16_08345 [Planctomycetota bacterium]|nr:hypothetical protein [Planctomycetota bacterium]
MDDWKIERRKRGCASCGREFESEELHGSAIRMAESRFGRIDGHLSCWERLFPAGGEAPFSFWTTKAPKRGKRGLEDVQAMVEFFKKLLERRSDDPVSEKILYLTSLLLMRKRRVKAAGTKTSGGRPVIVLEKAWDGETVEIPDPVIPDSEIESLRTELERIFDCEVGAGEPAKA